MDNRDIIQKYIDNGLIDTCLDYQFTRLPKEYKEDFKHDLIIELMSYDKLPNVEEEGHMNAFLTRVIKNNIYSTTSWYYRRYIRYDRDTDEITDREMNIAEG